MSAEGRTLGEMSPEERDAAVRKAAGLFQAELDHVAPALGELMDEQDAEAKTSIRAARAAVQRLTDDLIWHMLKQDEDPTDYELWKRRKAAAITETRRLLDLLEQNTRTQT